MVWFAFYVSTCKCLVVWCSPKMVPSPAWLPLRLRVVVDLTPWAEHSHYWTPLPTWGGGGGWLGHFLISVKSRKRSFVVHLYIESRSSCWPFDHFAHNNPFVYYSILQWIASRHCSFHCRSFPQLVVGSCWSECWLLFLFSTEFN